MNTFSEMILCIACPLILVALMMGMEMSRRREAEKDAEFWKDAASRWQKIAMDWRSVSNSFEQAADKNANMVERMLREHQ